VEVALAALQVVGEAVAHLDGGAELAVGVVDVYQEAADGEDVRGGPVFQLAGVPEGAEELLEEVG
jgi:hypothetical protein